MLKWLTICLLDHTLLSVILCITFCVELLPYFTNLSQASKEVLILLWALQTGRQIDWAHLFCHRMHKALWQNAPLPYPLLVTHFLQHFNIPLDDEPFVKVKRSFAIGAAVVASFGYRKDLDGQWIRKQDLPSNAPEECTPSPPPRDPSSSLLNDVLNKLQDLHAFVGDWFDSMDSHLT